MPVLKVLDDDDDDDGDGGELFIPKISRCVWTIPIKMLLRSLKYLNVFQRCHSFIFKYMPMHYLLRVVAVVSPLKARTICTMRHAKIVVVFVWILSAICALPIVFGTVCCLSLSGCSSLFELYRSYLQR